LNYIKFVLLFVLVHGVSYTVAGVIALRISKDIYENKSRLCDFLRDMADEKENDRVASYFLPAQVIRGVLMAVVLFPVLNPVIGLSLIMKFLFFAGLMFVFTHIAAVSPFMDNIEGLVYMKDKYIQLKSFFKFQLEMIVYSVLFSLIMSLFMELLF